ncbi:MAG: hypothetical protein KAT43_01410 [Nanoarchaeota archaeon]|nr:hypothetical protein [Nanoarchaeota archaeon]
MNEQLLLEAGLTQREIKVYLALLELGSTTTGPLVKKSGIPNCKVYETLDKLINKGLASYTIISKIKHFQASDPEMLLNFLEEKQKQIKEIIPELKLKQNLAENIQESTIYESIKGVKTAFNKILSTLNKGEEYLVFTLGEELGTEELKRFFIGYHKKRIEKKIKVKLIANEKMKKIFLRYHVFKGMKVKYTKQKLPTGIFIYGNNIMTVVWGQKPTAFVITSKNNADRYREFFEEMWKTAAV